MIYKVKIAVLVCSSQVGSVYFAFKVLLGLGGGGEVGGGGGRGRGKGVL